MRANLQASKVYSRVIPKIFMTAFFSKCAVNPRPIDLDAKRPLAEGEDIGRGYKARTPAASFWVVNGPRPLSQEFSVDRHTA
jgi:hypothetical protein